MATVTKKNTNDASKRVGATPWGNVNALTYKLATNAAGAVIGSDADQTDETASGTKIRLGVIPAGFRLVDYMSLISVAMTTSVTMKVGFEYVDGQDDPVVGQDDDYFAAAATATTAGVLRKTTVTPEVTLPKDAYLIVTTAGADNDQVSAAEFTVFVAAEGTR